MGAGQGGGDAPACSVRRRSPPPIPPPSRGRVRNAGAGASRGEGLIPSWPLIVGLAASSRALAQPAALLNDPDTYLHIAAGRWMLAHGALPVDDPFSHSFAGAVWVPHEWLAEVVLAAVFWAAGWSALVMGHLLVRPHILALPLLVIWSGALIAARDDGRAPPAWLLPLMALWANLHGSFMFGLGLLLFLGCEAVLQPGARLREARRWGVFGLLAVAAALLTPNGLSGFVEPIRLMAIPSLQASFREWLSPDFHTFQPLEICLLGLTALGFTTGARLPPSRLLLLLALCHMALVHVRHAELLGLAGPLIIAAPLGL